MSQPTTAMAALCSSSWFRGLVFALAFIAGNLAARGWSQLVWTMPWVIPAAPWADRLADLGPATVFGLICAAIGWPRVGGRVKGFLISAGMFFFTAYMLNLLMPWADSHGVGAWPLRLGFGLYFGLLGIAVEKPLSVRSVWTFIGAAWAVALLALIGGDLASGLQWRHGIPSRSALALVAALIGVLILLSAWQVCWQFRRLIVRSIGVDLQFVPAVPEDYPGMEVEKLAAQSAELESLGFVHTTDCRFASEADTHGPTFLRLFQHPEHHVLAELGFLFSRDGAPLIDLCSLTTYFERNWIWSTGNLKPNGILYLIRSPTTSGTSHVGAGPAELLKHHLEGRVELLERGLKVETDLSPSAYFAHARRAAVARKERVQRRNCLAVALEVWRFKPRPNHKWTGDYTLLENRQAKASF